MQSPSEEGAIVKKIIGPRRRKKFIKTAPLSVTVATESVFPEEPESVFPEESASLSLVTYRQTVDPKTGALDAPKQAAALIVDDQDTLDAANDFLISIKELTAKIEETFGPQIAKAHDLHKSLIAERKKFLLPLGNAEQITKAKIACYLLEQERIRREAERERARIEAAARAEAEKKLAAVEKAESKGDLARAEAIAAQAALAMARKIEAAPVVPDAPTTNGLSLREDFDFQITDASLLPREYLKPDEVKIRRVVKAMREETKIPGVRVWSKPVIAARVN